MTKQLPVVFYDGVCHLCHGLVQFVLKNEKKKGLCFSQLQSPFAKVSLGVNRQKLTTVVFFDQNTHRFYVKSSAIVRLLWCMGGVWRIFSLILWLIPLPLRNVGYAVIARVRYRLFGRSDVCMTEPNTDRFIIDP